MNLLQTINKIINLNPDKNKLIQLSVQHLFQSAELSRENFTYERIDKLDERNDKVSSSSKGLFYHALKKIRTLAKCVLTINTTRCELQKRWSTKKWGQSRYELAIEFSSFAI